MSWFSRRRLTLPTDSNARKELPLWSGFFKYFPAAIMGAAFHSKKGHAQHGLGGELHHARKRSTDHGDCVLRHLMDVGDLVVAHERGEDVSPREILDEADALVWRTCAFSQGLHERFGGAPFAPAARDFEQRSPEDIKAYLQRLNRNYGES